MERKRECTYEAGCQGKEAFDSRATAAMVAKRVKRHRTFRGGGLFPYRCPHCQKWHIGR